MANLTIRNLTATPLELKLVERYALPKPEEPKGFANITQTVTSLVRRDTPTSAAIAESSQAFATQDVSIHLEPLCTCGTEIQAANTDVKETVRLTFEVEGGERYRLDTPCPGNASTELVPLTATPRFRFTAIYLPNSPPFLTLFSSANLSSWMREIHDPIPLSALSIPGTHNSPTCYRALPSVRCQAVGVREQLDNGVRFLDIRVMPDPYTDHRLYLIHGVFPIAMTGHKHFIDVVQEVISFLETNPSESVIMSIKREGPGQHTDAQLSIRLRDHFITKDPERWWTSPRIPTLGESRGKMILMRRFGLDDSLKSEHEGQGWAINAETWKYNTPSDTCPGGDVCVQDFCEVLETENIDKKIQYVNEELQRSAGCVCKALPINLQSSSEGQPSEGEGQQGEGEQHHEEHETKQPFYINFLSASNFWKTECWPEKIAAKLNPAVIEYLCRKHYLLEDMGGKSDGMSKGDGSTGVVVCDWVGDGGNWDLVRCIVGFNVVLEIKGRSI
ncbi:MAG: hypothetical protein M1823_002917 [Watsoniomyces obsoletus]|nr:MAG: hypothetical protein M1823_002917 [Watsoniomyces obsoletus]